MRLTAGRSMLVALVTAALSLPVSNVLADVVNGTVSGGNVQIRNSDSKLVAELRPGPFQIVLPAGQYTTVCEGSGQPARPAKFLSLSTPVTVNFSCG